MAIDAENLNIILTARDREFAKAMERNTKAVQKFSQRTRKNLSSTTRNFDKLARAAKALIPVLIGAFSVQMVTNAAKFGKELSNLANISGIGVEQFQRLAMGARTVGISSEKLADIYKDVNDRVGEFVETGGGPMKDFFEKIAPAVGVTADQFARLSGPEALQLYVDTLEKAGVSQQELTFYLEAMASDTTALIPLLKSGGQEMKRLGDEAGKAGRIMSAETIEKVSALDDRFAEMKDTLRTQLITALGDSSDELETLADFVEDYGIPALEKLIGFTASAAELFDGLAKGVAEFIRLSKIAMNIDAPTGPGAQYSPEDYGPGHADPDPPATGAGQTGYVDENGNWVDYGTGNTKEIPGITAPKDPPKSTRTRSNTSSGGKGGRTSADKEMNSLLRERDRILKDLETEQEAYNRQVDTLNKLQQLGKISAEDYDKAMAHLRDELVKAKFEGLVDSLDDVSQALVRAAMYGEDLGESLGNVFRQIVADLIASNLTRHMTDLVTALGGGGSSGGTIMNFLGSLFKKRASGGSVQASQPYWTGEHGPEPFVPAVNGRVLSVGQAKQAMAGSGAGVVVNQTINVSTGVQQTVRAEIQTLLPKISEATKAAVADTARRNPRFKSSFS
jgi:hypothetical protein